MTGLSLVKNGVSSKIKAGDKFGRLKVLEIGEVRGRFVYFRCRCDCGNIRSVRGYDLHNGRTRSCGCLNREAVTKHGMQGTSVYQVWCDMIQRCTNPNNASYKYYGGRGITVCSEWQSSFLAFFDNIGMCPPRAHNRAC